MKPEVSPGKAFIRPDMRPLAGINIFGLDEALAVIKAAENLNSPVLLSLNEDFVRFCGKEFIAGFLREKARGAPVSIHFDHCRDIGFFETTVNWGFDSMMFDGTAHGFRKNLELTRRAVEIAHSRGIKAEGEIGCVPYAEGNTTLKLELSDPLQSAEFAAETGVDLLAVSIGNIQRMPSGYAELDLARLEAIRDQVSVPLCLHGASGVKPQDLSAAVRLGVRKFNFSSTFRNAWSKGVTEFGNQQGNLRDRMGLYGHVFPSLVSSAEKIIQSIS